jgi:putative colanic acid biosynthesis acetyltransferase WcaF
MQNPLVVPAWPRIVLLRLFGAKIGRGLVLKPTARVKYPWHLTIGNHCWIGERVWIDNYVRVTLGDNVCLSQGVYLCTGNHDFTDRHMGLIVLPIEVRSGAWIAAFARVAPGVVIGEEAVIGLGAVLAEDATDHSVYLGNPARPVGRRQIRDVLPPERPERA